MLALTKRTEYALIALHYMLEEGAIAEDGKSLGSNPPASAREIAERFRVPLPLLMNILKKLSTEGVLVSIRGAKGGYAIAVDPKKMTLSHLIILLEGPVSLVECASASHEALEKGGFDCKVSGGCPIRSPLRMLHHRLSNFLDTVTIQEICGRRDGAGMVHMAGSSSR